MEYMALATGIRVALLSGMTGSAIMEYSVMTLSHTIKMEDSDLYLLISNLLDNAMQHVGSKKNIVLEISEVGNCLKIIERNSIDHNVLKDGEFIV